MAALSAFAGGKFKAGEAVGQDQDWSLDFLLSPRQHTSVPHSGPPSLGSLAKCSPPVRKVG